MARLVLLIILGFVTMAYFPESRVVLADAAEPVLDPAYRWRAEQEMNRILRELRLYQRENFERLPDAEGFDGWLTRHLGYDAATDPWGSGYRIDHQIDQQEGSFAIVSAGPDGHLDTPDDVRATGFKERRAQR